MVYDGWLGSLENAKELGQDRYDENYYGLQEWRGKTSLKQVIGNEPEVCILCLGSGCLGDDFLCSVGGLWFDRSGGWRKGG